MKKAVLGGMALVLLLACPSAGSASSVDLLNAANVHVDGVSNNESTGRPVAPAGDVNDDGMDDVIVGAENADANGRINSGSAYVLYGRTNPTNASAASLGNAGFRIDGAAAGDSTGRTVSGVGDLNDDGVDDVVVGAYGAGNNGRANSGSAYIVYGQTTADPADLDLNNITGSAAARGLRIDGAAASDQLGLTGAGGADVNDDGIDDAIVGANGAGNNGRAFSGSTYVVYGQDAADPADLDLSNITTSAASRGMRIDGAVSGDQAGNIGDAGDVNADGIDDLIVGASGSSSLGRTFNGSAYLVYGETAADPADLDLNNITTSAAARGARFDGPSTGAGAGVSVSGAGDVNEDGIDDVAVGASGAAPNGNISGQAFVVYGRGVADPADFDLNEMTGSAAARGFQVDGESEFDQAGSSVRAGGDVNDDGIDDVIVGAPFADHNGRAGSGSAYVIYGQGTADPSDVDLTVIAGSATRGLSIDGAATFDQAGTSAAGSGDFNADGIDDVVVGAPGVDAGAGAAYVLGLAPTANPAAHGFGTVPRGGVSGPRTVTVTNRELAPLSVTGFSFSGANPDDYFAGADTCRSPIEPGDSCTVATRFAPQGTGARSATLTVETNSTADPTVALAGTGGALPRGPQGPQGPEGDQGPPGPAAEVTCKVKGKGKKKVKCKVSVEPASTAKRMRWRLSRGDRTVDRGKADPGATGARISTDRRNLRPGPYKLTITYRQAGERVEVATRIDVPSNIR